MSDFKSPTTEAEFNENFAPIKPLMSATEAYFESSRCLFCYDAPCVNACPTGIDIPLFIRQINSKNDLGAARTIYASNYFGYACGKVCPTEVLCEGACVYNHSDVNPIEIGRLQSYATQKAIAANLQLTVPAPSNGKKIAIIGAGPAGISCACELRQHGYLADIYEAKSQPSGLTVHGVAPYKITNDEVLNEVSYLQQQFGFNIFYNRPIGNASDISFLEKEYSAIFIGTGLGATTPLAVQGDHLQHVYGAVEFIERLRSVHQEVKVPASVIVLGGGNTAMDAASECARMGAASVILAYRRSKAEMSAYSFEYDLAKSVGVTGLFNVMPVEIMGDEQVNAVKFVNTKTEGGKVMVIPGSEFILPCDMVILATGQSRHKALFELIPGIELTSAGNLKCNASFQTSNPRYFAAGDIASGGEEVVNAVADGKKAAMGIIEWLDK